MAEESDLEKTEEPTGRRLEQAREKGQVPHSRELGTFLVLITAAAAFWMMGGWFVQRAVALTRKGFTLDTNLMHEPAAPGRFVHRCTGFLFSADRFVGAGSNSSSFLFERLGFFNHCVDA